MTVGDLVPYVLGLALGIGAVVVFMIRSKAVNREDPLQRRLADHLTAYLHSVADDAAFARLKADLKTELKARSVPREEWEFRVASASGLITAPLDRQRSDLIVAAITRMKLSA